MALDLQIVERLHNNDLTLTELYFIKNKIKLKGAVALAEALKVNETLTTLSLGWDNIERDGIQALVDALKVNQTLKNLSLRSIGLGIDAAKELAKALKINQTLVVLDVAHNNIGVEGSLALIGVLHQDNYTLLTLHGVYSDGATKFLERNKRIDTLLHPLNLFLQDGHLDFDDLVTNIEELSAIILKIFTDISQLPENSYLAEGYRMMIALSRLAIGNKDECLKLLTAINHPKFNRVVEKIYS